MKYPEKESSTLEFKQEIPENNQIVKTIVGFCNQNGGKLIIGVTDDGTIKGVAESDIEKTLEYIDQMFFDTTIPTIIPRVYTQIIANKLILIIEVSEGMNKPYYVRSEGLEKGTYIRLGRSTMRANSDIIQELQWAARGRPYDTMPLYQATINDLDIAKIKNFFKTRKGGKKVPKTLEEAFRAYHITAKEHSHEYPTVAGMLLFGKEPDHFVPEAYIMCTRFAGNAGREVIATLDCTGTLFEQMNEALNFILSKLSHSFTITGIRRHDVLEIPEVALREALLNAVIHRNYHIKSSIKVAIYNNRIEIFSPGGFPGPLNVQNLTLGFTYIRNLAITKIFREAGYIEKMGTGFITIFNSYEERNLPRPEIIEGENYIKCILPRPDHREQRHEIQNDDLQKIIALFQTATELSIGEIVAATYIPRATVGRKLTQLIQQKILKKTGTGSGTKYMLA
jgi:ATP-dependent DNA helicase RecG